ncbi:MAG: hypothetical protein AAFZ18_26560 [Myxococcota bacterium]
MPSPAFALTLALVGSQPPPSNPPPIPCTDAHHRDFDFWVGRWEVFTPNGKKAGDNHIEKILGGCVLREQWRSASGKSVGRSFNIFAGGKWHQTWVDNQGLLLELVGGLTAPGRMAMSQDTKDAEGKPLRHEITWTRLEGGEVKQTWRTSKDHGKSWTKVFVGIYRRPRS